MKLDQLLCEHLGNLSQLKLGKLVDVFRQTHWVNKHNVGKANFNERKFAHQHIGSNSKVIDVGQIADLAALRKAYRAHNEAENPQAFVLYIDGHAVAVGIFKSDDLRAPSAHGLFAFDLSKYDDDRSEVSKEENDYSRHTVNYSYPKVTRRYTGEPIRVSNLSKFIERVHKLAAGKPVTAKLVTADTERLLKRRDRSNRSLKDNEIFAGLEALKHRLTKYKLSKKPSVTTIGDFVKETLLKKNPIVQFGGKSYKTAPDLGSSINMTELLNGKPFMMKYYSVDPNERGYRGYDGIEVYYSYDPEDRTLIPYKASWYNGSRFERSLDAKRFIKTELRVDPDDKDATLKAILNLVKSRSTDKAYSAIDAVRNYGHDYPEFKVIEKSLKASKQDEA